MYISNQDDYIDGNELACEIETHKDDIEEKKDELVDASNAGEPTGRIEAELDDLEEELRPMVELEDSIFFSLNDVSLISVDVFEEYCQRFAIDSGEVEEESSVFAYIDWEGYARATRIDFSSVDFDGEEYLYRS